MLSRSRVFACLCVLLISVLPAAAVKREIDPRFAPIPQAETATTWQHRAERQKAWAKRVLIAPMRARAQGQAWLEEAAQFAEDAALTMVSMPEQRGQELHDRSRALMAKGCRDPLVLYFAGHFTRHEAKAEKLTLLREALQVAPDLPGPKSLHWLLLRELGMTLNVIVHVNTETLHFVPVMWTMLKDGSFREDERDLLLDQVLCHTDFVRRNPDMIMGLAEAVDLPLWFRKTIIGWVNWQRFLRLQSGNWPQTAASPGELLRVAREALTMAWQERPSAPLAAVAMIAVADLEGEFDRDSHGVESRLWFDRAVTAEFDCARAYQFLIYSYSPDGGGNIEMLLQLAEIFRQTGRMDTIVPRYFFHLCSLAAAQSPDWKTIYRRPEISKALVELSEARAKSVGYTHESVSFLAVNAWLAGDFKVAAEAYEKAGRKLDAGAVAKLATHKIANFEQELAVLNSPAASDYLQVQRLAQGPDKPALRQALQSALAKPAGKDTPFFTSQLAALDFAEKYETGEWVTVPIDPKSPCWGVATTAYPHLRMAPPPSDPSQRLTFAFPIGDDFELSVTLEDQQPRKMDDILTRIMLGVRAPGITPPYPVAAIFAVFEIDSGQGEDVATWVKGDLKKTKTSFKGLKLSAHNTIVLRFHGDTLTVGINGDTERHGESYLREPLDGQKTFGIELPPRVSSTVRELKIRKLQPKPRPEEERVFSLPPLPANPPTRSKRAADNEA